MSWLRFYGSRRWQYDFNKLLMLESNHLWAPCSIALTSPLPGEGSISICCLCNYIYIWLDIKSSRIKTINRRPRLTALHWSGSCGTLKNAWHCSKRVGDVEPGVMVYLTCAGHWSGVGKVRSYMDWSGSKKCAFICWRPISPLWFLRNSASGCKGGNWHQLSLISLSLSQYFNV